MIVVQYFVNTYTIKHLDTRTLSSLIQNKTDGITIRLSKLAFYTTILPRLRYSDSFSKLIHLLSEPVHVRNPVYLEIEFTVFILFDGADGMSGIKTSVKLGRIEFSFYPDLLELAQSSDYPVIKAQTFTQETYHGH